MLIIGAGSQDWRIRSYRGGNLDWRIRSYRGGNLDLSNSNIKCLPDSFPEITGNLLLSDCKYLETLPNDLIISGKLVINGCVSLKSFPAITMVKELYASGCTSLQYLPDNLRANYISLYNCVSLETLPKNLYVSEILILSGASVRSIPCDLYAKAISMSNCKHILSNYNHCVYSYVSQLAEPSQLVGELFQEIIDWCDENDIERVRETFHIKHFSISCDTIPDPAQMMHYRLRWG